MGRPRKDGSPAAKPGTAAKRQPKAEKPKAQAAATADVSQQISERKLKALLKSASNTTKDVRELAGTLGNQIAQAVEHDHLHRKAFSTIRALDRMSAEKLAEYFDAFDYYRDISGLQKRAESAPNFLGSAHADAEEDPDETENDGADTTVHAFRRPALADAI